MYRANKQTGGRAGTWLFHASLQSLAMVAVFCLSASAPSLANETLGIWLNTDRKGKIQLRECGDNSLCGKLIWLKDAVDEKGKPWRDLLNPDPKLRKRDVVGIDVLIGTKKIGPMTWQGKIYDPQVGKIYYLKHLKVGKDKVEIKGCLSTGWPCRTKYWTRTAPPPGQAPVMIAKRNAPPKTNPTPGPVPWAARPVVVAPPPVKTVKRNALPKTNPKPAPVPRAARTAAVAPPNPKPKPGPVPWAVRTAAVAPPAPVSPAPPVQRRIPYPAPGAQPIPADVTAALPRPAASPGQGGYLVQVAARQSHNEALKAYNDLQRRYPQLLGKLLPRVMRTDLGQRGIWYRVGVGPMAQQSAALNFCRRLKAVGADCLIRQR